MGKAAARMWGSYSVRRAAARMGDPTVWRGLPPGWGGVLWCGEGCLNHGRVMIISFISFQEKEVKVKAKQLGGLLP